jgi:O-antigen/teichoic acid export membrane protein
MRKSVVYNSVLTVFRQLIGTVFGLLSVMLIARVLGSEGQGQYALLILFPIIIYTLFNSGVPTASVYFIAQKKYSLNEVYSTNFFSGLLLSLFSFIIGLLVVYFFKDHFFEGTSNQFLLCILLVLPLMYTQRSFQSIFQGKEDFEKFNIIIILNQLGLLLFSVVFVWLFRLGIVGAVVSFFATQLLMLLVSVVLLKKTYGLLWPNCFSKAYLKESLVYGLKGHVSNVLTFINYRLDMFIIAFLLDDVAVGIYSIAVALAEKIWIVSQSISTVLFARVSSLTSDVERNNFTVVAARNTLLLTAVGGALLAIGGNWLIVPFFGVEYAASVLPFLLLIPGVVLFSLGRIVANDFAGRGKPEINTYVAFVVATTNVILNFWLIPKHGVLGAALATSSSYLLDVLLKSFVFCWINKVSIIDLMLIKRKDVLLYQNQWRKLKEVLKK